MKLKIVNNTSGECETIVVNNSTTEDDLLKTIRSVTGPRQRDYPLGDWVENMSMLIFSIQMDTNTYADYWASKLGIKIERVI